MPLRRGLLPLVALFGCDSGTNCPDDTALEDVTVIDWHTNDSAAGADLYAIALERGQGVAVGAAGAMVATADGGESWQPVASGVTADLWGAWRADDGETWVVGAEGTVLVDEGSGFATRDVGATDGLRAVAFAGSFGAIVGERFAAAWDDGAWTTSQPELVLNAVDVIETGERWAVGDAGVLLEWDGFVWQFVNTDTAADLRGVALLDADRGVIVGDGPTARWTADGGGTWSDAAVAPTDDLTSVIAVGDTLLATDVTGGVWRSETDGDTWLELYESGVTGLRSIDAFEDASMPNTQTIAAGSAGRVAVYGTRTEQQPVAPGWDDCR